MLRAPFLLLCVFVVLGIGGTIRAESLEIIDEVSYTIDERINSQDDYYDFHRICALALSGDTLISASNAGIWARFDSSAPWRKLLAGPWAIPSADFIEFIQKTTWKNKTQCPPAKMWRSPPGDIVLLVRNELRVLNIRDGDRSFVKQCKKAAGQGCECNAHQFNLYTAGVGGGQFLGGCVLYSDDSLLVLMHMACESEDPECRLIFRIPSALRRALDSVNVRQPWSLPALDSAANAIWVPIWGYQYIYIIDTTGTILDSLLIDKSDYINPPTARSRLWTDAVWSEWLERWTPLRSFDYVSPGYFILQYRVGRDAACTDTVVQYSTAVWNADRQPVELEVDPHWQVAGVQPDGRIIFGHYRVDGDDRKVVLTVARIVP